MKLINYFYLLFQNIVVSYCIGENNMENEIEFKIRLTQEERILIEYLRTHPEYDETINKLIDTKFNSSDSCE